MPAVRLGLPDGQQIENPTLERLTDLLLRADQRFWSYQSGTVGIWFRESADSDEAQLVLVMKDPPGVFVQHIAAGEHDEYCLSAGTDETIIVAYAGGEPMALPAMLLVPREMALRAVVEFVRSGKRAPDLTWVSY